MRDGVKRVKITLALREDVITWLRLQLRFHGDLSRIVENALLVQMPKPVPPVEQKPVEQTQPVTS